MEFCSKPIEKNIVSEKGSDYDCLFFQDLFQQMVQIFRCSPNLNKWGSPHGFATCRSENSHILSLENWSVDMFSLLPISSLFGFCQMFHEQGEESCSPIPDFNDCRNHKRPTLSSFARPANVCLNNDGLMDWWIMTWPGVRLKLFWRRPFFFFSYVNITLPPPMLHKPDRSR